MIMIATSAAPTTISAKVPPPLGPPIETQYGWDAVCPVKHMVPRTSIAFQEVRKGHHTYTVLSLIAPPMKMTQNRKCRNLQQQCESR